MSKTPSLKRNFFYRTLYQILTVIVPFITTPYLSRVLGTEKIGIQSFTESIVAYFIMFALLGTGTYGTREVARIRDDKEKASVLFWEIEILQFITGGIALLSWVIFIIFSYQYQIYYLILTIELLSVIFEITWFFSAFEQIGFIVLRDSIIKLINLLLIFLFVKNENDLFKYIIITSTSKLVSSFSTYSLLPKYLIKVELKDFWKHMGHHLKETMIYFLPTISTSIYRVLDKVLIGVITKTPAQNGFYEQAEKLINMVKQIAVTSINTVVGVRTTYLFAKELYDEVKAKIEFSFNFIMAIGIAAGFGIAAVATQFVPIFYGPGYDEVVYLLYVFAPVPAIVGISNCLGSQYYNPVGKRLKSAIFLIIGAGINLILNIILIPYFKAFGAAVATVIAESVIAVLYLSNCDKYMTFKKLFKIIWKKIISGLTMFVIIYLFGRYLHFKNYIILSIQIITGALVYSGMLIILKDSWVLTILNKILIKLRIKKN